MTALIRSNSASVLRSALHNLGTCLQGEGKNQTESHDAIAQFIASLSKPELLAFLYDWELWARDDQLPPNADNPNWTNWLILGGRGAGKTRSGAEWVRSVVHADGEQSEPLRIALVGETLDDVRSVMIEGESGLLAVHQKHQRPIFESSKKQLVWPNGTIAQIFSAHSPEGLRGPQFHAAWCDELCKWKEAQATWDMLQFGLRLGDWPRVVITTTPKPSKLLKTIMADESTVISRAATSANAENLAPSFLQAIAKRYHGTRLGRQELEGEILEEREDALWRRADLDQLRRSEPPELTRIVVAIDPPVTSTNTSDACGLVVAALGADGRGYILADRSLERASPLSWAQAAVEAFHHFEADALVAEVNQGGDLVETVIRQIDPSLPLKKVHASRGKWLRAEPVAALYEQARISHVGSFDALEDEMVNFGTDGLTNGHSPDRLDALVYAVSELMLASGRTPRVRRL